MLTKTLAFAVTGIALFALPAFARDLPNTNQDGGYATVASLTIQPEQVPNFNRPPFGMSSLMCSPSGFGHTSTCRPKALASRHHPIDLSSR